MNRLKYAVVMGLLFCFISTAHAEVYKNTLELDGFLGGYAFLAHRDQFKAGFIWGLRAGWNFDYGLGLELAFDHFPRDANRFQFIQLDLNLLYHFYNKGRVIPYVTGGVGFTRFYPESGPNNNALNVNGGLGVKLFTWRTMGFRFDVRYFYLGNGPFNTSVRMHNLEATVGFFALLFAPPPPPKDKDNDGLNDDVDKCPNEPEDKDGFEDNDGCPELDNDKDGIPDEKDQCPNEAEDMNNFQDEDGCPELDKDGDGISDKNDKCPDEAEDKDNFQDDDGCPDPDDDNDKVCDPWVSEKGLLDKYKEVCRGADKCPDESETLNGFQDDDGCPDQTKAKIVGKKIEISETILFKSGTDEILTESFGVLNDVLNILKSNPEIKKVSIEGHTDTRGSAASNKKLSQKRADSVKKYLIDNGIAQERLQSIGYGEEKPIVPKEKTKADFQKNRRVEFLIQD